VINLHIFHSVSLVQVRTWPSKNVSANLVLLIACTCCSALSNCPSVSISTAQSSAGDCVLSPTMFCCLFVFSVGDVVADRFRFFSLRHYLLFRFQLNHRYLVLLFFVFSHDPASSSFPCCFSLMIQAFWVVWYAYTTGY
jgi:hypothetical protein